MWLCTDVKSQYFELWKYVMKNIHSCPLISAISLNCILFYINPIHRSSDASVCQYNLFASYLCTKHDFGSPYHQIFDKLDKFYLKTWIFRINFITYANVLGGFPQTTLNVIRTQICDKIAHYSGYLTGGYKWTNCAGTEGRTTLTEKVFSTIFFHVMF